MQSGSFNESEGFVIIDHDKTDVNNVPFAVIKVRTQNIDDKQRCELIFQGNAAIDVELAYKTGEVWVYLTYEADYVKISHPDFSSTEFWLPFDMKPGHGYEMTLVNKSNIGAVKQQFGYLIVKADQTNAVISIDGKNRGTMPRILDDTLIGTHELKLEKTGCVTIKKNVTLDEKDMLTINEKL